jgi:hypothetical protein
LIDKLYFNRLTWRHFITSSLQSNEAISFPNSTGLASAKRYEWTTPTYRTMFFHGGRRVVFFHGTSRLARRRDGSAATPPPPRVHTRGRGHGQLPPTYPGPACCLHRLNAHLATPLHNVLVVHFLARWVPPIKTTRPPMKPQHTPSSSFRLDRSS